MGNTISRNQPETYNNNQDFTTNVLVNNKRKLEETEQSPTVKEATQKRLRTTSEYIYQTLFLNGENSDVTIKALGQEWKLHKVYIRQAGYFSSMFHDQWKESSMSEITLHIPDQMIDKNALSITFGSLYKEDVQISAKNVIPVLAAASLIQFEGLMTLCSEVMKETVCVENVCKYYKYAGMYGQSEVSEICIKWLERNLMTAVSDTLLRDLDVQLLKTVIMSPNLLVIQIEMDVYNLVKKWLFLQLNQEVSLSGSGKTSLQVADNYFRTLAKTSKDSFLETEAGQQYKPIFKAVRLQHLIRDFVSSTEIEKDKILPTSWLLKLYREQWLCMLRIEHSLDVGPKNLVTEHVNKHGFRCGRLLLYDTDHCWRWNGFNFGMDLLVTYNSQAISKRNITIKRNVSTQRCHTTVHLAAKRSLIYKIQVTSVDKFGREKICFATELEKLRLRRDEEVVVLVLKENINWETLFPLAITATFQLVNTLDSPEMTESGYNINSIADPLL